MAYNIKKPVRVDIRVNGADYSLDLEQGEHELDQPVAELLIAQGVAELITEQPKEPKPKTSKPKTIDTEEKN